jgi:hypothetical protein
MLARVLNIPRDEDSAREGGAAAAPSAPSGGGAAVVLVVVLLACAGLLAGAHGIAAVLMAPALFLAPGWLLLAALRVNRGFRSPDEIGLVVVSSMAIMEAGSTIMLWAGHWHPRPFVYLWLLAAGLLAVWRLRHQGPGAFPLLRLAPSDWVPLALVGAGLALWLVSFRFTNIWAPCTYGLFQITPVSWPLAVALLVIASAWLVSSPSSSVAAQAVAVLALILVIFCFVPVLTGTPVYAWAFKHIGVTRFLESAGHTVPNADIYNRWPAFFAGVAMLSKTMGVDPLLLARWAEPFFVALQCSLVYGCGLALLGRRTIAATAAALFVLTNWVGQDYFAPQPAAYAMYLAVLYLIARSLLRPSSSRLLRVLRMLIPTLPDDVAWPALAAAQVHWGEIALALALDLVLVATHQLTPYMLTAQLAAMAILGFLRKGPLIPLVSLVTALAYLAPNFAFVSRKYGLLHGVNLLKLNPFKNALVTPGASLDRAPLAAHAGIYFSMLVVALTLFAAATLIRRGRVIEVAFLLSMIAAPCAILFAGNYGGEATLRIFLFSSPWCALMIAAGLSTFSMPRAKLLTLAAALTLAPVFLVTLYVNLGTSVYPADEIAASEYFFSHAPAGSALVLGGSNFPSWVGGQYVEMTASLVGDASPNLLEAPQFKQQPPQPAQLAAVERYLEQQSAHPFLAFSWSQERYAHNYGPLPRNWTVKLEAAVKRSPDFKLWHQTSHVRIYELVAATAP